MASPELSRLCSPGRQSACGYHFYKGRRFARPAGKRLSHKYYRQASSKHRFIQHYNKQTLCTYKTDDLVPFYHGLSPVTPPRRVATNNFRLKASFRGAWRPTRADRSLVRTNSGKAPSHTGSTNCNNSNNNWRCERNSGANAATLASCRAKVRRRDRTHPTVRNQRMVQPRTPSEESCNALIAVNAPSRISCSTTIPRSFYDLAPRRGRHTQTST